MTKETKNNGHPEGGIYELFAYTLKLLAYPNNSHMNELSEMPKPAMEIEKYKIVHNGVRT